MPSDVEHAEFTNHANRQSSASHYCHPCPAHTFYRLSSGRSIRSLDEPEASARQMAKQAISTCVCTLVYPFAEECVRSTVSLRVGVEEDVSLLLLDATEEFSAVHVEIDRARFSRSMSLGLILLCLDSGFCIARPSISSTCSLFGILILLLHGACMLFGSSIVVVDGQRVMGLKSNYCESTSRFDCLKPYTLHEAGRNEIKRKYH